MNEQKNNGRGIFYGVIGVATLVVAIIGATFAYFTATASNNDVIVGNMATIQFGLNVTKVTHVDESKNGMIPMSNNMVEAAVLDTASGNAAQTCVDDNGNAVCQIYKITVTNTGSASLFLDGYVSLVGGSGTPTDFTNWTNITGEDVTKPTMRWAQVFCTGTETDEITGCTTAGKTTTTAAGASDGSGSGSVSGIDVDWDALGNTSDDTGFDADKILTTANSGTGYISGNSYKIIDRNYIRVSDHDASVTGYDRDADVTSALVYNQYLDAKDGSHDEQVYYIVVWLSETGTNQTVGADAAATSALSFFTGTVAFNSAQGSEVTATFNGYAAVPSDQV